MLPRAMMRASQGTDKAIRGSERDKIAISPMSWC